MAAPQTERSFGPEAQARRQRRAERDARFRAAVEEAVVETWSPHATETARDVIDAATDEALATTGERAQMRAATEALRERYRRVRPRSPSARRRCVRGSPAVSRSAGARRSTSTSRA